ncbi:MAG: ABC transporter permease [Dehalococcoidia bacterium]|jgi:oligopeptide transport system permease protein
MARAVTLGKPLATEQPLAQRSLWRDAARRLLRNRLAVVGLVVVLTMVVLAVFAGQIAPHDPNAQDCATGALRGSSSDHPLGTDAVCRDVLSRLLFGARVSLSVGILTQVVVLLIALPIGAIAALSTRLVDNLLMRITDLTYAFPDLLLIIILSRVLADVAVPGGSLTVIILAISLVGWVTIARLVRAQMLSLREREYVMAAEALGASRWRIAVTHLLPNSLGPVIVALSFAVPQAIFAEASLSYIGIGIAPPQATWGGMVQAGYSAIYSVPMLVVYPAVAIALTVMAFTFIGDGLRDALDPRAARRI